MWLAEIVAPEVELERGGAVHLHPLALAAWQVTWRSLTCGFGIGIAAGALAGSLLVPGAGTLVGAVVGCYVAVIPTALGWVGLLTVLFARHRPLVDPARAARHMGIVLVSLVLLLLTLPAVWGISELWGTRVTSVAVGFSLWLGADLVVTTWFVVAMLRRAGDTILRGWAQPWGWRRPEPVVLVAPGHREAVPS